MLNKDTKIIMSTALRSAGVEPFKILAAFAVLEGKPTEKPERLPIYVSQAEAARLASVSRFTIRKMVKTGKLDAVEVVPGLIRYRVDQLMAL